MRIKTRESLRTIKTFDRAESLADKTKNGASGIKEYADDMQSDRYQSENEYAGNQVESTEARVARNTVYGVQKIGNWGVQETAKNIQNYRNRPIKLQVNQPKKLKSPSQKRLPKGTVKNTGKVASKSAKNTAKATKKAAKSTVKASQKAAQAAKKAVQVTIKAVKVAFKAVIAAVKAVVAAVKGIVAAIAAGGWIAVVIILLICIVALIVGSVFGIFMPSDSSESEITLTQSIKNAERDFYEQIEVAKSRYDYDMCYTTGEPCDKSFAIAVYAVKENQTTEVVTFDREKAEVLQNIYIDLNTVNMHMETVVETEMQLETQIDGTMITVETEIVKKYLYVTISPYSTSEAIVLYGFDKKEAEKLQNLLSDEFMDMWDELLK